MSIFMRALALVAFASVSAPVAAATPWWFNIGFNLGHVANASATNCGGGQGGFTLGGKMMVRAQFSHISYENVDTHGSDECDVGYWGDSDVTETALLVGVMGRGGGYLVLGPARADFGDVDAFDDPGKPHGQDVGFRVELGFSSRRQSYAPVGYELMVFQTSNDIERYVGAGINLTFGPRRKRVSAPRPPAR